MCLEAQELQYIEFFAGQANVWRAVSSRYKAARVDLSYEPYEEPKYKAVKRGKMLQNPMDILSDAGFAMLSFQHAGTLTLANALHRF